MARLQRVDADGDGYEDPEPSGDTPPPTVPDPGQPPPPDPTLPVQLTVNITGSFGPEAFAPNPLQAATGNTVVWQNGDLIQHNIVLDDGTPVGDLAPGQSSAPLTVVNAVTGYHCTLHSTMVGQITVAAEPPPPVQLTVNITGAFGTGAFNPNPLQGTVGNTIVWMNSDFINHDIVLEDGTQVGNLAPGQSSLPMALANPTTNYRCTFHPTMVGQITMVPAGEQPPPGDQPPGGQPPPTGEPPPTPDPGGGVPPPSDGYY